MLNFIKSAFILKTITDYLDTKIKLKIFKINKALLEKLEINKKDFIKFYSEKLLNKCDSKHLKGKLIDNNVLEFLDLSKVIIKDDDYILNLSDNKIENLKPFEKGAFLYKYDFLYLSNNLISNIESLEKNDFKDLLRLILSNNKIRDINVLERAKLNKLKALNLSNNEISDISVLEKANLYELEELYLHGNKILDILVLKSVKFKKLFILDLSKNKISDITVFKNLNNLRHLKHLNLSKNEITNISVFTHWIENYYNLESQDLGSESDGVKMPVKILGQLEILDLSQNKFIFNYDYKKITIKEEILGLVNDRTILILDDNKYKI